MAAAFFNALADEAKAVAVAAGTQPADRVHPEAVAAMAAEGIDLSAARPQLLTDDLARGASILITMGCGEACPFVPGLARDDWQLSDPKGQSAERVAQIRDQIRTKVAELIAVKGWAK